MLGTRPPRNIPPADAPELERVSKVLLEEPAAVSDCRQGPTWQTLEREEVVLARKEKNKKGFRAVAEKVINGLPNHT